MKVYAFVGPSGTGKSYRAQWVASERDISYIIDDGLLIKDNTIICGSSAKKASTKVGTVKMAVFNNKEQQDEVKKEIKKYKVDSVMVLGTSNDMVEKIVKNLGLPQISEYIYIEDVATEEEMKTAKRIRQTEGKHVIPVPTFEIKKDFSGYLLDPLQIFKSKGRGQQPYISEKSIIRPTFSYLGGFSISDTAVRQIIEYIAKKTEGIDRVLRVRVTKTDGGMTVYVEVAILYGYTLITVLKNLREKIKKELENLTAMYIEAVEIVAKTIVMPVDRSNIIAIDGPAGAGKGAISKKLANEIGFDNFDTGALYRCVSLKIIRNNIELSNTDEIVKIAKEMDITFKKDGEDELVFLNGEDVTKVIREDKVNSIVSEVSTIKELRDQILIIQRKLAKDKNMVVEGRDIGTCVFPNAKVKIYLDASIEERARRRYKENVEKGINTTYEETLELLKRRDKIDMTREVAPLRKANDAVIVDTTEMTIDEVVERIKRIVG